MDSDTIKAVGGLEVALQNGAYDQQQHIVSGEVEEKFTESLRLNGDSESGSKFEEGGNAGEVNEVANVKVPNNGLTVAEEGEVKSAVVSKQQPKPGKGVSKSKNEKPSVTKKVVSSTEVKQSKDGKGPEATKPTVANGSGTLDPHPKKSLKSKSFNDRQANVSKQPGKNDPGTSEGLVERPKVKPSIKVKAEEVEADAQSSSPTSGDAKPRRTGSLPNYGFSFRCDERAEKRREFYTKLEEKIHAKEVEKNNMQAKSKETQEAEIKMFRKSLNFKATPMPSFYLEPPPPKVELKKIPTTRAKSPKLGRKKAPGSGESEGNGTPTCRPSRLSLDEKLTRPSPANKGVSPVPMKKPLRKSLPKLPSEKTNLTHTKKDHPTVPEEQKVEESSTPSTAVKEPEAASPTYEDEQETTPAVEVPYEVQPPIVEPEPEPEEGSSPIVGEQVQPTTIVQETIAMEN